MPSSLKKSFLTSVTKHTKAPTVKLLLNQSVFLFDYLDVHIFKLSESQLKYHPTVLHGI